MLFVTDIFNVDIPDINFALCTHVIYAFVGVHHENYTLKSTDPSVDYNRNGFRDFAALKKDHPQLKLMIGVGGWCESNDGTVKFSKLAASSENTATFITSLIKFIKHYNLDGLDFSWKYPPEADKANHAKLMSTIKSAFKRHGYLLSAQIAAGAVRDEQCN